MSIRLGQNLRMRQEMKINPRLYQAMDLLYMPLLDLQQHLKQELLGNPFLELVEEERAVRLDHYDNQSRQAGRHRIHAGDQQSGSRHHWRQQGRRKAGRI